MENNNGNFLFLDRINFNALVFIQRKRLRGKLVLLDKPNFSQKFFAYLLKLQGYDISEAGFFAGHLKTENGDSAYLAATYASRRIAEQAALEILESNPILHKINSDFGKNTLHLHLTKQLVWYIRYWTERIIISKVLAGNNSFQICLIYPDRISPKVISNDFSSTEILFYTPSWVSLFTYLHKSKTVYLELIRYFLFPFNGKRNYPIQVTQVTEKPGVLLLQEDTLRSDTSLRGQPHWFDFESRQKLYNTFIIKSASDKTELDKETKAEFENNQIFVLEPFAFKDAFASMRHHNSLKNIRDRKRELIKSILFSKGFKSRYFIIRTALFLKQAEFMGSISLWLNIRVFLFRESYIPLTDALQLVSKSLCVKTIAYQYSSLGAFSPIMMNTADKMLVFSDQFKNIFSNKYFSPSAYLQTGYLYKEISNIIRARSLQIREKLLLGGVKFIICFFDESVQYNRWGMISKKDHLQELAVLAQAVIQDPSIAVIIKSQYQRNTPSRLYPNDVLISKAVLCGRFIELHSGTIRNDIFPSEAALIADISIGHKFGATASLEAAIAGIRSVMLDSYGTKTVWDEYYDNELITFSSMESIMDAIRQFRLENEKYEHLGDWKSFLDILTVNKDISSVKILQDLAEAACKN